MSLSAPIISAEETSYPNFELCQYMYKYEKLSKQNVNNVNDDRIAECKQSILKIVEDDSMAVIYESICQKYTWVLSDELLLSMK